MESKKTTKASRRSLSRREILLGSGAALALGTFGRAPMVLGQNKQFAGVTLNGQAFSHGYMEKIAPLFPEFEEKTGIKVNLQTQGFFIFNQRMDLELSTGGRSFDFANITFIYMGRWIGAGWYRDLEPIFADPEWTEPEWDPADFMEGSMSHLRNDAGKRHGVPWLTDAMMMAVGRYDILEKKGLSWPKTFDEFLNVCEMTDGIEGVKAYTQENNHHWAWVPWLMGMGGGIFKDPPENLTPVLTTPEAAKAGEWYGRLLRDFSPDGVLTFSNDQAMRSQISGRANMRNHGVSVMTPLVLHPDSVVSKTTKFGQMPEGPNGYFPGIASHAWGIPTGSRQPRAAWEFIKWATSKEMFKRLSVDYNYSAVTRRSALENPAYVDKMQLNGQNVAQIYLDVLNRGGTTGYMKYRTVPAFPQVGATINKAMERIVTNQQSAADALAQAQTESIIDLKKGGFKVDS